jgi:hypothetical protein
MSDHELPSVGESDDDDMGVVESAGVGVDLGEGHFLAWVVVDVVEDHHELSKHIVDFDRRFDLGGDENFDRQCIIKYL